MFVTIVTVIVTILYTIVTPTRNQYIDVGTVIKNCNTVNITMSMYYDNTARLKKSL